MDPQIGIEVLDMALSVPVAGPETRPAVRGLYARVSAAAVARLFARAGVEGRLVDGGAEVTVKLPVSHAKVALVVSVAGKGRLHVEARTLSVGDRLKVPGWMVGIGMALSRVERKPGIRRMGQKTLEVDVGKLLEGARVPVRWQAGVRSVRVTAEHAEIECGPPPDPPLPLTGVAAFG